MALGDYTPTAWVNDTTPAINATNLGHIETKVDEIDSWAATATPAGSMTMYAGASVPTGWLLCDGQAVSRTTYAALFTAISTTWGIGNGSTTFNVPDMRESAPVGVGTFSAVAGTTHGTQVASDIYTLSQFKDDQSQGHYHKFTAYVIEGAGPGLALVPGGGTVNHNTGNVLGSVTDTTSGTPRNGTVTRGKRIGLNFIIKT